MRKSRHRVDFPSGSYAAQFDLAFPKFLRPSIGKLVK